MKDKNGISKPNHFLDSHEQIWRTKAGKFFPGERVVFCGCDLHKEFAESDWMTLLLYAVTGKRFQDNELKLLNSIWVYTNYPDSRIWNNRIVALGGNSKSTCCMSVGAAIAASEATIFGKQPDLRCIQFLMSALQELDAGQSLRQIIKNELKLNRSIGGFGRPLLKGDERLPHILSRAKSLNLDKGKHLSLLFRIQKQLIEDRYPFELNYGGVAAALCADLGMSASEYYVWGTVGFSAAMIPIYVEAMQKQEGTFFPIRCESIICEGKWGKRSWHKA